MVYLNTIKYLIIHGNFRKITKSIKFYVIDKIKRRNISSVKNELNINNCKMKILSKDEGISSELIIYGVHEPLTTELILSEIKPGMTILDIGSNIGYYAILESNLIGTTGKIYSIEPSPINFKLLEENLKLQKMNNFEIFNLAIGNKNEKLEFLISEKSNWSKIKQDSDIIGKNDTIITVPVKSLNLFCKENNLDKIDLIRMDVEGYEEKIIEGGKEILKKIKPILMIEIHKMYLGKERTIKILKELNELGYEIKYYYPRIFDTPIIAEKKDIKKISINELIMHINKNKAPEAFQLTLIKN
jgi:FkbM family methyltransferase